MNADINFSNYKVSKEELKIEIIEKEKLKEMEDE